MTAYRYTSPATGRTREAGSLKTLTEAVHTEVLATGCTIRVEKRFDDRWMPFTQVTPTRRPRHRPSPERHAMTTTRTTATVTRIGGGWTLTTALELTDAEACALTFQANPALVRLGDYVEVTDAEGTRIGHVAGGTYHPGSLARDTRPFGTYTIELM
jgi:hypothetical protein